MKDLELLKNINDIDDDLVCEAESWKPRKAKKLRIAFIAAAAAALCATTAVTAVASRMAQRDVIVNGEPLEIADYNVYTDEKGREIRTYVYDMPDFALGEEVEGCTPVGQVRVFERDDGLWGGWGIVDEEGNVFNWGINNKKIFYDVVDPNDPDASYWTDLPCANFLLDYSIYYYCEDFDGDKLTDKINMYVYRYDDKETARRIEEKYHGYFDEEEFDERVERCRKELSIADELSVDTADEE